MGFGIGSIVGGIGGGAPGFLLGSAYDRRMGGGGASGPGAPKYPNFKMKKAGSFEKKMTPDEIARVDLSGALKPARDAAQAVNQAAARRFQLQRDRMSQDLNKSRQGTFDALQRRFASMGGGASGARLKIEQQASEASDRQMRDAMSEIDSAEELAQAERDAASVDREANVALQQGQLDQQRNLAQADQNFRTKVFSFERGSKLHELDLAERQQKIDQVTTKFNSQIAAQMARPPKEGMLSGLLGGII